MAGRIGIAIITCDRKDMVRETVRSVRMLTRRDDVDYVVADDGSVDGTVAMLRGDDVPVVTGVNMGVAWNKNRALYLLAQVRRCEVVIVLEDDAEPDRAGWEDGWIAAAERWGHVNYAGDWLADRIRGGTGTAADPFMMDSPTAQCAAYSRDALDWGGYFDSRFRGYGHEHVEHSRRLLRVGFGGTEEQADGQETLRFAAIKGDVTCKPSVSTGTDEQATRNLAIARQAMADQGYRVPWRNLAEMRQFRSEIGSAIDARPGGFGLRAGPTTRAAAAPSRPGPWARLFRRRT